MQDLKKKLLFSELDKGVFSSLIQTETENWAYFISQMTNQKSSFPKVEWRAIIS